MSYDLFSDSAKDTALDAVGGTIMGSVETELLKQVFVAVGNSGGGGAAVGSTREIDADATLTNTDLVVFVGASSNDVTLTLPKASLHSGKLLFIRVIGTDGGSYTVTLVRNATDDNINGSGTPVSSTLASKSWLLVADANGWYTFAP